jgi:hypothetical protein
LFALLRAEMSDEQWIVLLSWTFLDSLRDALGLDCDHYGRMLEDWRVIPLLDEAMRGLNIAALPGRAAQPTRLLACQQGWLRRLGRRAPDKLVNALLEPDDVRRWLQMNIYVGKHWFNQEAFENWWFYLAVEGLLEILDVHTTRSRKVDRLERTAEVLLRIRESAFEAGFELERWLEILENPEDQNSQE